MHRLILLLDNFIYMLTRTKKELYEDNWDVSRVWVDVSRVWVDVSRVWVDVSRVWVDVSRVWGDKDL